MQKLDKRYPMTRQYLKVLVYALLDFSKIHPFLGTIFLQHSPRLKEKGDKAKENKM